MDIYSDDQSENDQKTVECDSSTFIEMVRRVYWLSPRTIKELFFGRLVKVWRCVKCGEEFFRKPLGQCHRKL